MNVKVEKLKLTATAVFFAYLGIFIASQFIGTLTFRYLWGFLGLANAINRLSSENYG